MNGGRPEGGPHSTGLTLLEARDVLARVVKAREELGYEPPVAHAILADLEEHLAIVIARAETGTGAR
jgi:hypothetical protein